MQFDILFILTFWAAVFIVCECQDTNGENSFIDSHTS